MTHKKSDSWRQHAIWEKWQDGNCTYWLRQPDGVWNLQTVQEHTLVHIYLSDDVDPTKPPLRLNLKQRDAILASKELLMVPMRHFYLTESQATALLKLIDTKGPLVTMLKQKRMFSLDLRDEIIQLVNQYHALDPQFAAASQPKP